MYRVILKHGLVDENALILSTPYIDGVRMLTATIDYDVTAFPVMTLQILPNHPNYNSFVPYVTFVEVIDDTTHTSVFEGRTATITETMDENGLVSKQVVVNGLLDILHDSIQPFAIYKNMTVQQFLQALINAHNAQVEAEKHFRLGTVTVNDTRYNAYRATDDATTTYDTIQSQLTGMSGGEVRASDQNGQLVLDYEPQISFDGGQIIRLGRNMISLTREWDPTSMATAVKPLGTTQDSSNTNTSDSNNPDYDVTPRLNISSVNGGSLILTDPDLVKAYGTIVKAETYDDVTDANVLKSNGQSVLQQQKPIKQTVQLTALDMADAGVNTGRLLLYGKYRILNSALAFDETLRMVAMTLDLYEPTNSAYTLGDSPLVNEKYLARVAAEAKSLNQINNQLASRLLATTSALKSLADTSKTYQQQIDAIKKQIEEQHGGGSGDSYYSGNIIDVSEFQASIDWSKVVAAGLALAVIRVQDGTTHEDLTYKTNIPAAIKAGANYGVYAMFEGISTGDSATEATNFYNRAKAAIGSGTAPRLWMIDVEGNSMSNMRNGVSAYMDQLNKLGVPDSSIVLYIANDKYDSYNLNVSRAGGIWIPDYGTNDGTIAGASKPAHPYDLWQYTSVGRVSGISTNVDMSTDPSDKFKNSFLSK
ncbi:phage tail protein [Lactobacillus rhamnosus]|uniref:Phage tail protein n=1 Tax=Lacticaseibacillus rhamnosus TaxID=47715 RepID=A0A7Y7QGY3_LACRH|nr:GH25 family lysozyme [Lacticaseibacillus rhamnosus]NVO88956.1 phage tail protein [Lacticaseibacillus rhamnosus]